MDLSLCTFESTERRRVNVWRCGECECACMYGRKKKTPSAIPVCWLLWFVVLRLHAAWIMLELQRKKKKKISSVTWPRFERGVVIQARRCWSISNNMLLMSSWSLRKAGGRVLLRGKQQSYEPSLGFMCYSFRQGTGSAKFVSVIKCFLNLMTPTVYIRLWSCMKQSSSSTGKK